MKFVNLLPKFKQQEIVYETYFHSLIFFIELALVSLALLFVAQFGVRLFLDQQIRQHDRDITALHLIVDKQDNAELKKQITIVNGFVTDFSELDNMTPAWSKVLRAFATHIPDGVSIRALSTDYAKAEIEIRGVAETRDQVIQLHDNIERDTDNFLNIDYPLENISQPTDVNFHFTFSIQESLLKQ